jgi:hypothetical protein
MPAWFRALCAALALATTAAQALPLAGGDDACCSEERAPERDEAPCPDCPPGLACGCCAVRGVEPAATAALAPISTAGVGVAFVDATLAGRTAPADIFHPPRR